MSDETIDHTIAKTVMGWTLQELPPQAKVRDPYGNPAKCWHDTNGNPMADSGWSPSTRIQDAWEVVDKVGLLDNRNLSRSLATGVWKVYYNGVAIGTGDTAPRAICDAVLELQAEEEQCSPSQEMPRD